MINDTIETANNINIIRLSEEYIKDNTDSDNDSQNDIIINNNNNIDNNTIINLPWYVPGPSMSKEKISHKFNLWDWEDLRDFLCLIGLQSQELESNIPIVGKINDYKRIIMLISNSMWTIQTYANNKTYDSIAMEARVIVEAVCTYFLKERFQDLGESLKFIEEKNPLLNKLLRKLRRIGCVSVHLNITLTKNKNIFRIDEDTAYSIIFTVFDVLKIVRDDIVENDENSSQIAILNLYKNRIKLSTNRLCLETIETNKNKSCADESKIEGCCKIGCPYLHKCDKDFDKEDSLKNLQILQMMKQKKRKIL